jgi:hypothetical protein
MVKSLNFYKFQRCVQTFLTYDLTQFLGLTHLSTKDKIISQISTEISRSTIGPHNKIDFTTKLSNILKF